MFSNVVVKSVSGCGVYCVPCLARHTIHNNIGYRSQGTVSFPQRKRLTEDNYKL